MTIRINRVYTRTGDGGETRLAHGQAVSKGAQRVEAYGAVDELGANLGFLAELIAAPGSQIASEHVDTLRRRIERIQQELFDVGALLATDPSDLTPDRADVPPVYIERLESEIDAWNLDLPELRSFVLAAGGVAGAHAHVCRTVCRRAERELVRLGLGGVPQNCIRYLNRLSDHLFVLARHLGALSGAAETLWEAGRTE